MFKRLKNEEKIYDFLEKATILLVIFLIIFSAAALYIKVPKVKEAVALATTKKPEIFTELYFENHLNLPSTASKEKEYSFQFTIHNLEYKEMNYPYEVYIEINGRRYYLEKGTLVLNHDEYKTITKTFTATIATRSAVIVNLVDKNQAIHFWIDGEKE